MQSDSVSRRGFLTKSIGGAAAFQIIRPELVRGAGDEKLKAGLIGCGGRGTQAMENILTACPNVEITAMADVFEDRLESSFRASQKLKPELSSRFKVDGEHKFVGFEAYKKVIASDVDIIMLATNPAYRPIHFEAAVEAKKHIFCEKPMGTDPVHVRRFMAAAKKSQELKLTVKSGAQRRSQTWYLDYYKRYKGGEFGELVAMDANWVGTPVLNFNSPLFPNHKRDPKWGDLEFQQRNWYSFVWICGDQIVEQHLHNIDVCNWFMGAHPIEVTASGGAAWRPREEEYGNIYDHVHADFVYPNGVHMSSHCRQYANPAAQNVSERLVGTKGVIDSAALRGARLQVNPYEQEHADMVASILGKGPYINEAMEVAESTMTCIMGREAAYSGLRITWDMIMNSQQDLMPKNFDMKASFPVPPLPVPGKYKFV
ncbi:MAG TPA: Gfo/Idh/MocA family oxidoreductase [Candidatus Acidoferrales bacterium]|nr:Gfo/Idh/MocA family oxidoreductase [Candidatus Acidoferrales bacterium]